MLSLITKELEECTKIAANYNRKQASVHIKLAGVLSLCESIPQIV